MTKRKRWMIARLGLVALLLVGCGDSDDAPVAREGIFIDSPVQGLSYETPAQSGVTDGSGTFRYEEGQIIGFYLGGLFLGETPAKPQISPLDLVEGAEDLSHPAVTNMSRLLLSLDGDCNPENGIQIRESVRQMFESESLDFNLSPDDFGQAPEVIALFTELNSTGAFACEPVTLWEPLAARDHLRESLGKTIETPSCFKFYFERESDGTPITEFQWYAEGVSYSGISPERSCECDGDDPTPPCPGRISSFTVERNEQIRVYAEVNNGTRYYLKDDNDGTFSLTKDVTSASVFDTPEVEGSCLWNQNVGNCRYLDGEDGILPVSGIDYAPDIHSFTISDPDGNGQVDAGETVSLIVEVTDAEGGPITPDWQSSCADVILANPSNSGDIFSVEFTAPDHSAICQVTFTATDNSLNSSSITENILVHGELGDLARH